MNSPRILRGIELRYVLAINLALHGPATIPTMIETLEWQGFSLAGRASKAVSDALRWEMRHDRVRRLRRGVYGPGEMPRSTEQHIHNRVMELRAEAATSRHNDMFWEVLGA